MPYQSDRSGSGGGGAGLTLGPETNEFVSTAAREYLRNR